MGTTPRDGSDAPTERAHARVVSPLGPLLLIGHDDALERIVFPTGRHATVAPPELPADVDVDAGADAGAFERTRDVLARFFAGSLTTFDEIAGPVLAPTGTDFQRSVWHELARIPYGDTVGYAELAARIGRAGAARAVGAANGANPLPIIVPCHRVIGANGTLTGFAGGLEAKRLLLALEARVRVERGEPVRRQLSLF